MRRLRSQLEAYIAAALGEDYLQRSTHETELRQVKREIAKLNKTLKALQDRRMTLEAALGG